MSDLLNHYYFGRDVLDVLPNECYIKTISLKHFDAFRFGTQGPDFLYYCILSAGGSQARKLAKYIHTTNSARFFYDSLIYVEDLYQEQKIDDAEIVYAYIAGFTTHYVLDVATHPLIFNRTGRNTGKKGERIYSYYHKAYEVLLDTAMMNYHSMKAHEILPQKVFSLTEKATRVLADFYEYISKKVYDCPISKRTFRDAVFQSRKINSWTMDRKGAKRRLIWPMEKAIHEELVITRMLIPESTAFKKVLNLNHELWRDPITGEEHHESYPQIFYRAVDDCAKLLKKVDEIVIKNNFTYSDILALYKNLSYLSGHDCNKSQNFVYFDYFFNHPQDVHNYCA